MQAERPIVMDPTWTGILDLTHVHGVTIDCRGMTTEPTLSDDSCYALHISAEGHSVSREAIPVLSATYASQGVIHLTGVLSTDLAARIGQAWRGADFQWTAAPGVGDRLLERPGHGGAGLLHALRRPDIFRWLEDITACGPINDVQGDIVRHDPTCPQGLDWHDDTSDRGRRLAITINLDDRPYDGGVFEVRRRGETALLTRHVHRRVGETLIFGVDRRFEHRLTPVTTSARTVFAGWFLSEAP
jgi:hypothetical protein